MNTSDGYQSALDARSHVVELALSHLGNDVSQNAYQMTEVRADKRPANWSGPFALAVLNSAGLCNWGWRPTIGFVYKLTRVVPTRLYPGDVVFFDRPPRDEVIDAEEIGPTGELRSIRTEGRATNRGRRRTREAEGQHYGIVIDILPTGALRIVKGAHQGAVGVLTVSPDSLSACYSIASLVNKFGVPVPEPEPEPEPAPDTEPNGNEYRDASLDAEAPTNPELAAIHEPIQPPSEPGHSDLAAEMTAEEALLARERHFQPPSEPGHSLEEAATGNGGEGGLIGSHMWPLDDDPSEE